MNDLVIARIFSLLAKKLWNKIPQEAKDILLEKEGMNKEVFTYKYVQEMIKEMKKKPIFSKDDEREMEYLTGEEIEDEIDNLIKNRFESVTFTSMNTLESKKYKLKK